MSKKKLEISAIELSKQWKKFLEKRNLSPEIYNQQVVKKREKKGEASFLKIAKNKKEIDLLLRARRIVDSSIKKVNENQSAFKLEKDVYDFYTLEVFENLKPEIKKNNYISAKDLHKGNYYSKDVYEMITQSYPWYIACHEYYRMNINDNADEDIYTDNYNNLEWI